MIFVDRILCSRCEPTVPAEPQKENLRDRTARLHDARDEGGRVGEPRDEECAQDPHGEGRVRRADASGGLTLIDGALERVMKFVARGGSLVERFAGAWPRGLF